MTKMLVLSNPVYLVASSMTCAIVYCLNSHAVLWALQTRVGRLLSLIERGAREQFSVEF